MTLNEIYSTLIDIREIALKLKSNKNSLKLSRPDFECFQKISGINGVLFEKHLRNLTLNTDKETLNTSLSHMKSTILIFLSYYKENSIKFNSLSRTELIESWLEHEQLIRDDSYEKFKVSSSKYFTANDKIEATAYSTSITDSDLIVLRRLEKTAKIEYKKLEKLYYANCKAYNLKFNEYNLLTFIEFREVIEKLNQFLVVINSIQNQKNILPNESINIVGYELISIAYKLSSDYFTIHMNEERLGNILNLKECLEKTPFKHGKQGNFRLIIRNISKLLNYDDYKVSNWKTNLLESLVLKASTQDKGNLTNEKETAIINKAFIHLMELKK